MKRIVLLLFICTFTLQGYSRNTYVGFEKYSFAKKKKNGGFDRTKLFTGGGLGFNFIPRGFMFNISPTIGYSFSNNFQLGTTIGFNYIQESIPYQNSLTGVNSMYSYKYPFYSTSVFARVIPFPSIILQVEPEINNYKVLNSLYYNNTTGNLVEDSKRVNIFSFLVGGGYVQQMGGRAQSMIMVMYDVARNPNSPYYGRPVIRGGINFGIFNK